MMQYRGIATTFDVIKKGYYRTNAGTTGGTSPVSDSAQKFGFILNLEGDEFSSSIQFFISDRYAIYIRMYNRGWDGWTKLH